jgi:hypothetical protein
MSNAGSAAAHEDRFAGQRKPHALEADDECNCPIAVGCDQLLKMFVQRMDFLWVCLCHSSHEAIEDFHNCRVTFRVVEILQTVLILWAMLMDELLDGDDHAAPEVLVAGCDLMCGAANGSDGAEAIRFRVRGLRRGVVFGAS